MNGLRKLKNLSDIKVVIVGQDPYPTEGVATGVAFACEKIQPSLRYMLRDIKRDITPEEISNFDCSLSKWQEQGVMLINASLTCEVKKPTIHEHIWQPFTEKFLKYLNDNTFDFINGSQNIIFVFMGKSAQKFKYCINEKIHHIINCPHPAAEVYHEGIFIGCGVFNKINEKLKELNKTEIQWL